VKGHERDPLFRPVTKTVVSPGLNPGSGASGLKKVRLDPGVFVPKARHIGRGGSLTRSRLEACHKDHGFPRNESRVRGLRPQDSAFRFPNFIRWYTRQMTPAGAICHSGAGISGVGEFQGQVPPGNPLLLKFLRVSEMIRT